MTIEAFGKLCREVLPEGYWIAWRETPGGADGVQFGSVRTRYRGYKLAAPFTITQATVDHLNTETFKHKAEMVVNSAISKLREDMRAIEGTR